MYFQKPFRESFSRFSFYTQASIQKSKSPLAKTMIKTRYKLITLSYFTLTIYNIFEAQTKTINAHFPDRSNFIVHR